MTTGAPHDPAPAGTSTAGSSVSQPPNADDRAASRSRWPLILRILITAVALLAAIFSSFVLIFIPGLSGETDNRVAASLVNIVQCLWTFAIALLLVWLMMRFIERRPMRESGWRWTRSSLGLLGLGLGLSLLIVGGISLILVATGRLEVHEVNWQGATTAIIIASVASTLAQAFFLQGIPEELLFRGWLMQTMRDRPLAALIVSALFFGVLHWFSTSGADMSTGNRLLYLIWPTGFGFLAAVLVLRLRSLWPAIGVHAGSHVANMLIGFLGISPENPWGWIFIGLGYLVAGAIFLRGIDWSKPIELSR